MRHATLIGLLLLPLGAAAQIVITNPGIPESERFTYSDSLAPAGRTVEQSMVMRTEGTSRWYEFQSHSFDTDVMVKVDTKTLFISSIETTSRTKDSVLHRQLEVIRVLRSPAPNELVVNDLATLPVVLRGFPWGKVSTAKLVYLGANAASGDYSFELNVVGQETIQAAGKSFRCWKAQIGLAGIYGPFFNKTTLWYDSVPPYILVKVEQPTGGPGSAMRTQQLLSYDATP